ncbi:MAG: hypothetical protein HN778_09495 [Prolixibacteraceae bacterium]|nr:hypothetical protein [Prolixibacteraceae bacterium]MBT6997258.1 hypothetical protein [Prolixibacteraceae bacterium]MBT7395052.1 hypothetical protein [Prolixibacteraceae bacterium]
MKLKILIILLVQLFWFVNFWHANAQNDPLVAEIEAEDGELDGVRIDSVNTGFSGKGYVTGFDSSADKLTVSVTIYERGFYKLFIRYNGLNGDKYQQLFINGKGQGNVQFPKTETFANIEVGKFLLEEGENLITIKSDWGYTDFDKFEIYAAEKNQFNIVEDLVDPDATEETRALYRFLKLQFGERIISGQTTSYFTELKNLAGKTPMINNEDLKSYTEGYPYKWSGGHVFGAVDDGRVNRLIEWYNSTNGKGIVAFQWHWHSPTGGEAGTNTFYTEYTDFDIRLAVIPGTEEYDLIIRDIDAIALQLKKFQDANIPVIFRPLHEAGGGWFWWGAKGSEPCKKLYDIIFERIKNHHQIHNLIWVWSTPETDWYPGNDKVDIIGHDSYPGAFNYGPQKASFDKLFNLTNGEKLIAMTENGPIPDPGECFELDAPWLWFMSWSNLVNEQNSVEHIQEVFANSRVLTIESTNAKTDNSWRSTLYPENWKPGFKDLNNRFLHDFSYAGYHQGEKEIPVIEKNIVDVTQQPYGADNSGETDVTQIIQQALDDVGQGGGGVVYIPSGTYKVNPGSAESALRIQYNNTILRGAGSDSTFIFNDASYMRQKNIVWMMGQYCTWSEQFGTTTKLSSDLLFPTQIIPVKSVLGFEEGDQIILRTDGTDDFIEEHGMSNIWTEWAADLCFCAKSILLMLKTI